MPAQPVPMKTPQHHLMSLTTAVLVAILAAGCATGPAASNGRAPKNAEAAATPTPSTHNTSTPGQVCFNPHGGQCLGDLKPGTYGTTVFQPTIHYRVGSGWVNAEDLPGNFWLYRSNDPQDGFVGGSYIGIYTGARVPKGCQEVWEPRVDDSPEEMRKWYVDHPGLQVTNQREVTLGGLRGVSLDLALASGYERSCPWSEGRPVVPMIIGNGVSELHHVILRDLAVRLVLLKWQDSNVTIEITSTLHQHTFNEYMELTAPVIKSLKFDG